MQLTLASLVVAAALKVHRRLGCDLPCANYRQALVQELAQRRIRVARNVSLTGIARGSSTFDRNEGLDLVIEKKLIVEVRTLETLLSIHDAQMISLLRLSDQEEALVLNFGATNLHHGIRRYALVQGRARIRPWCWPPPESGTTDIFQTYRERPQSHAKLNEMEERK